MWSSFQYSDDVKVLECLNRCGMAFATSQAFFITSEKKHNSIPFNLQNAKHCQHDYLARARKWNTATHSHTFVVICWFCCTAPSHSFTPRSSLCPHPHPCMSTDFPVSASVSTEVNTGLFDESVWKQPGDLPWHAHTYTHTQTLGKCHVVWIKTVS